MSLESFKDQLRQAPRKSSKEIIVNMSKCQAAWSLEVIQPDNDLRSTGLAAALRRKTHRGWVHNY